MRKEHGAAFKTDPNVAAACEVFEICVTPLNSQLVKRHVLL